jgi:hypothetical protein
MARSVQLMVEVTRRSSKASLLHHFKFVRPRREMPIGSGFPQALALISQKARMKVSQEAQARLDLGVGYTLPSLGKSGVVEIFENEEPPSVVFFQMDGLGNPTPERCVRRKISIPSELDAIRTKLSFVPRVASPAPWMAAGRLGAYEFHDERRPARGVAQKAKNRTIPTPE